MGARPADYVVLVAPPAAVAAAVEVVLHSGEPEAFLPLLLVLQPLTTLGIVVGLVQLTRSSRGPSTFRLTVYRTGRERAATALTGSALTRAVFTRSAFAKSSGESAFAKSSSTGPGSSGTESGSVSAESGSVGAAPTSAAPIGARSTGARSTGAESVGGESVGGESVGGESGFAESAGPASVGATRVFAAPAFAALPAFRRQCVFNGLLSAALVLMALNGMRVTGRIVPTMAWAILVINGFTVLMLLLRMIRSGPLLLTADGIAIAGGRTFVPWEALGPGPESSLWTIARPELVRGRPIKRFQPGQDVPLDVSLWFLFRAIHSYVEHPEQRPAIGTPAELDRLRGALARQVG